MTMTAIAPEPVVAPELEEEQKPITKVSIIISKGTLEGVYPGLIMANGARMEGIEANLFFTFFGMDAVLKRKQDKIKVATVGNPALGVPTLLGALPGMSGFVTRQMMKKMEQLDSPPIGEFVQMIADSHLHLRYVRDEQRLRRRRGNDRWPSRNPSLRCCLDAVERPTGRALAPEKLRHSAWPWFGSRWVPRSRETASRSSRRAP